MNSQYEQMNEEYVNENWKNPSHRVIIGGKKLRKKGRKITPGAKERYRNQLVYTIFYKTMESVVNIISKSIKGMHVCSVWLNMNQQMKKHIPWLLSLHTDLLLCYFIYFNIY